MSSVGIIANPASGKDIRRLVAYATVFDNNEKVNLVRRILIGLDALGVQKVYFMPDYFGFYQRATDGLTGQHRLALETCLLDMPMEFNQADSRRAAALMAAAGVRCIITLGGDGTNRVVAQGAGEVPLLPISTGTNNVFPVMVEGTIAGLAAGLLVTGAVRPDQALVRSKKLVIYINGRPADSALVDAVVLTDRFIGSRAVWEVDKIKQLVVTRGAATNIGIASVAGGIRHIRMEEPLGMHLEVGDDNAPLQVKAAIGPGLVRKVPVARYQLLVPGQRVTVLENPCVIALDGEREIQVNRGDRAEVELSPAGPLVVDINHTMSTAVAGGAFLNKTPAGGV
ncbi:ATP-NAD kinase family protein [Desulfotomaculum copahuensis]|uniref:ATP-NAD kinase n=1 Tax=Desulfotomaculum copahuensis TaxID=1838280 RepID=A0A1B7LJ70_9FIRM|nr:NAD(+)/NADH kinase [Desulfotomaculum copahuensis]OAT86615.1 ATP-NAD kinase [Desulfotomaculum copahuensis]